MAILRMILLRYRLPASTICKRGVSGQTLTDDSGGGLASEFLDESELKKRLLDSALKFVPSTGWTAETVALGANELQLPDISAGMFDDPGASLVFHYIRTKNGELVEYMKEESRLKQQPKISFGNFVTNSIKHRLQLNIPYVERMPEALSIATRPDQFPESTRLLLKMCDDICFYGGDQSTNYVWYTKRTSIAGVYAATELFMLQDKSVHYEDTWRFMHRRFEDVRFIGGSTKRATSTASTILDLAYSFYVVGRNTLGLNTESQSWRRK